MTQRALEFKSGFVESSGYKKIPENEKSAGLRSVEITGYACE